MQIRMIRIENFVGGSLQDSLDGTFRVSSPFFEYSFEVPNSCVLDAGDTFSKAREAQKKCAILSLEERCSILKRAAEKFTISEEELTHLVKMQGMPCRFVEKHAMYSREQFLHIAHAAEQRHGFALDQLGRSMGVCGFELSRPGDGIAVAFIPPNDPAEAAFVMSHAVLSGAALVVKPSQSEPYMALKVASLLTECGYPPGGISVLHWNTADASRKELTQALLRDSRYQIVMGDYETAYSLLGSVENRTAKRCAFSAGRSKAIVDEGADLERVAELLIESSFHWTNNCVSTKSVVVVGDGLDVLVSLLGRKCEGAVVGNPLNTDTTVGYVDEKLLDHVEQVVKGQTDFSYAQCYNPFTRMSRVQMRPLLVHLPRPDAESPFVSHELPYTLALMSVPTFDDAVRFVNETGMHLPEKKSMAVSLYAKEPSFDAYVQRNPERLKLLTDLKTYMLCYNRPSTSLSPRLRHQGVDLAGFLSSPLTIVEPEF